MFILGKLPSIQCPHRAFIFLKHSTSYAVQAQDGDALWAVRVGCSLSMEAHNFWGNYSKRQAQKAGDALTTGQPASLPPASPQWPRCSLRSCSLQTAWLLDADKLGGKQDLASAVALSKVGLLRGGFTAEGAVKEMALGCRCWVTTGKSQLFFLYFPPFLLFQLESLLLPLQDNEQGKANPSALLDNRRLCPVSPA